jgi:hypothetical protein
MFAGPPAALRQAPEMGPRPIFVVGMPRSGTSLVEQILASHSHVHGAGELDLLRRSVLPSMEKALAEGAFAPGAADLSAIADTYRAGLARLSTDAAVVVDKLPGNAKWLGFALSAMPEAKAVWVTREPMATAWSIFRTYFPAKGLGYTSDLADILAYQRLQDRLAERWAALFPGRFLRFSYEALTEAQEKETRRLLAFCGLGWEDACLLFHENARAVRTASALQVRQPLYRGSSRDWMRYEAFVRPLLAPDAS